MTTKTPVDYARQAVTDLTVAVGQLAGCVQQGVQRPWKTPALTLERRNEIDREARAERLERDDIAPGESPAPLDLDVMDELVKILDATEVLLQRVCWSILRPVPPPASSAFTDPRPHLLLLTKLLAEASFSAHDPGLMRWVETRAKDLIEDAHETLGLITDGQVLKAICPWCGGRTEAKPTGGELTMRIRNVEGTDTTVVTCEGGLCEPPPEDCGTWIRGKPAWLPSEWDWLAKRLDYANISTA